LCKQTSRGAITNAQGVTQEREEEETLGSSWAGGEGFWDKVLASRAGLTHQAGLPQVEKMRMGRRNSKIT
jgi:hypothetical protein